MIGFLLGTTGDNIFRPEMGNIIGGTAFSLNANNLEVGKTYRVILEDICGRKDSVDYVYSPSSGIAPAIPINDSTAVKLKCNYSNTDSLASIYIKKMPIGYDLSRAYVNGVVANGLGFTGVLLADGDFGYVLNTKLPPGTYSYTLVYRNGCASNSVTKSIVIPPYPALQYRKSFNATVVNIAQSCSGDGKTYIQLNGFVKNVTTRNKVTAVRLISVPNNTVFPLNASNDYSGIPLFSILNSPSYFNGYIIDNNDSSYLFPESYRLFIEPNQIGTYKFAMDIQCEDGSFVETLIATVNVSAAIPYMPRIPSLANANALMCDGGSVLNINTTASGGVGALYYEYKVESSSTWIPTASSGASNSVIINPMPAAGTIYDVRVTDGCGSSSTIKVVAQNFTGNFYIHSFFPDCANPSAIALRTSSVLGAIYTWRKNGMIIGNGTNLYQLNTTIVNGDNITVDVNIFNCYYKNATKVFNPNFENYTWFGIDNNWFNAANWCPGVPTPTSNVKIPAGLATYPIIPTGDALCKNILIENTAFVKVTNNGRLNLYGVITNNGTLDLIDGTLVAKGTQAQVFSGAIFYKRTIKNIEIANSFSTNPVVSLSTTLNDTLNITGNVSYGNVNNKEFKTNDNLTLKSSAARTASLNDITNGGANYGNSIVGKVNVERYMFARSAWRLLATPIQIATSPTVSQAWRENNSAHSATGYGTRITGPVGPFGAVGSLDDYTINPSMKSYNALTNNFTGVTNANTTPIANNKGYYVFVRGDRGAAAVIGLSGITNLRIKGDLRTGDQVFSVPANKFESIGNPFASRIDMRLVNKTNVVNAFYVWNPNNTGLYNVGGYEAYVYNTSTTNYERIGDGLVRNYIESGEAFFVQSNVATAGSLTIKEQDKGNGSANVSRMGVSVPTMDITLYAQNTDSSMYITDGIKINFDATYSNDLDNNDVRKITNSYDNIGLKNGTANLIVERRNNLQATDTLRFNVSGLRVANYRLDIDPSVLDYPGLEAIFIDKFLQTRTVVSFTDVTSIAFTTTADAASKATDRFMIVFKATAIVSFKNIAAVRTEDKVVKINWTVDNEANEGNYTIEHSTDGVNFTAIGTETAINNNGAAASYNKIHSNASTEKNWYRVKANNALGAPKYSAIALVNEVIKTAANTKVTSTIVPRVNRDGQVSVVLNNYEVGKYILLITNATGQVIKQNQVNVNADKFIVDLKTNSVSKGNYQVTLINTNGEKTSCAFIVM